MDPETKPPISALIRVNPVSDKRNRKSITLQQKYQIIAMYESGKSKAKICRELGMSESTIRCIIKKRDIYKKRSQMKTVRTRNIAMIRMEDLLLEWIKECYNEQISLTRNEIKEKALELFRIVRNSLKESGDPQADEAHFTASSGWLDRFKLRNKFQSEPTDTVTRYLWVPPTDNNLETEDRSQTENYETNENDNHESNEGGNYNSYYEFLNNEQNIVNIKEEKVDGSFDEQDCTSSLSDDDHMLSTYVVNPLESCEETEAEEKPSNQNVIDAFFLTMAATVKHFSPFKQHLAKTKIFQIVSEIELSHLRESCSNDQLTVDKKTNGV